MSEKGKMLTIPRRKLLVSSEARQFGSRQYGGLGAYNKFGIRFDIVNLSAPIQTIEPYVHEKGFNLCLFVYKVAP